MTKGFATALLPLFLLGCREEPTRDVAYYLKNEVEREAKFEACRKLPRSGMDDPECENAALAVRGAAIEGLKGVAKKRVLMSLKDPESARFSDVAYREAGTDKYICGYVNAKNSYGGYVGPRQFIYGNGFLSIAEGEDPNSVVDAEIAKACGGQ